MSGEHQTWTNEDIDYKRESREGTRPGSPRDAEKHKQRTPSPGNRSSQSPGRRRNSSRSRSPSPHSSQNNNSKPNKVLTVFGLHTDTTENEIKDSFGRFGNLEHINLILDRRSGRSKGFAFLYYADIESAVKAKEQGHGLIINGRSLRTDFSKTTKAHDPTPGKYMGRVTHNYRSDRYDRDYYYNRNRRSRSPRDSYDRYRDDRYGRDRYRSSRDYYDDRYSNYYHDSRYEDRYDDRYRDYDRHRR